MYGFIEEIQHVRAKNRTIIAFISRSAISWFSMNNDTNFYTDRWFLTSVAILLVSNKKKKGDDFKLLRNCFRRWILELMDMEKCHHGRFDELNCCNLHWLSIFATIEAIISLQIEGRVDRTIKPITWQSGEKNVFLRWSPSFGKRMLLLQKLSDIIISKYKMLDVQVLRQNLGWRLQENK